jgi:flagellar FliL protein
MAETQDDIEIIDPSSKRSKLVIIIIIVILILALAGVAAVMLFGSEDNPAVENEAAVIVKQTPIYYSLEKPLIVNFNEQSNGSVRYLSIKLKVMARDQQVIDAFKLNEPAIQHELLMLLLGQKYDELNLPEGIKTLQQQTLITINEVLKAEKTTGKLESVYFTSLLMQ